MSDVFWVTVVLVWVFGWAAVWLLRRRMVESRELEKRQLLHRERMAAIERGVPLPELPPEEERIPTWLQPEAERLRGAWLRRLSLLLGLVALFGGLGICAGFHWAPDRGYQAMWTLGLIPAMAGVGLLLYFVLATGISPDDR